MANLVAIGGGAYSFGTIAGVGVLAKPVSFTDRLASPSTHTLQWNCVGTAPSACTLRLEGSLDGATWFDLTGAQTATASSMVHIVQKPVTFVRVFVISYTQGDASTAVSVFYTRGVE